MNILHYITPHNNLEVYNMPKSVLIYAHLNVSTNQVHNLLSSNVTKESKCLLELKIMRITYTIDKHTNQVGRIGFPVFGKVSRKC